jgi:FkbM family methyltransferase
MNRLTKHLHYFSTVVSSARGGGLSAMDTLRVLAADYGSRLGGKPREYTIHIHGAPLLIRSNPVDYRVALEVFGGAYRIHPPKPVTRILDLGANIGSTALYFHQCFPNAHIACVEPSPNNLSMLRRNAEMNRLPVTIFDCAVGPGNGAKKFYETDDPSCCTLLEAGSGAKEFTVRLVSIPEIMASMGWDRIDLLKIDIEGYEREIFRDSPAWLSQVSAMIGEIHEGYDIAQLGKDLGPYSFKIEVPSPTNEYGQAIFVALA